MLVKNGSPWLVAFGAIVATALGVGAILAYLAPATRTSPEAAREIPPAATVSPRPATRLSPTVRAGTSSPIVPTTTPRPAGPVELSLVSVDRQPSQGGLTIVVGLTNHQATPLTLNFDPPHDLELRDARGMTWPLRWAEYHGSATIGPEVTAQLARAFFAGDVTNVAAWPLTVAVHRVPGARTSQWRLARTGPPTPQPSASVVPLPPSDPPGPLALTLANVEPSSALGGIQVDLELHNGLASDLVFQFDPSSQLSAVDNLGRSYQVRWAQYDGTVRVAPGATARLTRAFLSGPIAEDQTAWLRVTLRQVPGARPLNATVSLS